MHGQHGSCTCVCSEQLMEGDLSAVNASVALRVEQRFPRPQAARPRFVAHASLPPAPQQALRTGPWGPYSEGIPF